MTVKKDFFDAGSPFSCWLKEELIGEIANHIQGRKSKLIEKYHVNTSDGYEDFILHHVTKFDDYPNPLQLMARDIIRRELDPTFEI